MITPSELKKFYVVAGVAAFFAAGSPTREQRLNVENASYAPSPLSSTGFVEGPINTVAALRVKGKKMTRDAEDLCARMKKLKVTCNRHSISKKTKHKDKTQKKAVDSGSDADDSEKDGSATNQMKLAQPAMTQMLPTQPAVNQMQLSQPALKTDDEIHDEDQNILKNQKMNDGEDQIDMEVDLLNLNVKHGVKEVTLADGVTETYEYQEGPDGEVRHGKTTIDIRGVYNGASVSVKVQCEYHKGEKGGSVSYEANVGPDHGASFTGNFLDNKFQLQGRTPGNKSVSCVQDGDMVQYVLSDSGQISRVKESRGESFSGAENALDVDGFREYIKKHSMEERTETIAAEFARGFRGEGSEDDKKESEQGGKESESENMEKLENLSGNELDQMFQDPQAMELLRRLFDLTPLNEEEGSSIPHAPCPICKKCLVDQKHKHEGVVVTSCGHMFCEKCLISWLVQSQNRDCVVCNTNLKEISFTTECED